MTDETPSRSPRRSNRLLIEGTQQPGVTASHGITDQPADHKHPRIAVRASFGQFYRAEMAPLIQFIRRYGADAYAAADAAQAAFAEAYPQWSTIENPRAWLRTVACRIYYRQRLRETPVENVPDRPVIYEDTMELGEQGRRVFQALAALPERQRQVMAWHLDGYDNSEIAELLGMTTGAVRQNLCRGRQALKQRFELQQDGQKGESR